MRPPDPTVNFAGRLEKRPDTVGEPQLNRQVAKFWTTAASPDTGLTVGIAGSLLCDRGADDWMDAGFANSIRPFCKTPSGPCRNSQIIVPSVHLNKYNVNNSVVTSIVKTEGDSAWES